jgi:molecular chaperone GrpE
MHSDEGAFDGAKRPKRDSVESSAAQGEMNDLDAIEVAAESEEDVLQAESDSRVGELSDALRQLNDKYLRLLADFDTFRRRTNKEREDISVRAQAAFAASLLESLDDLARVTSSRADGASAAAFVEGIDLVAKKLMKSLTNSGLEIVDPAGATFDPALHEAVSAQPATSPDDDGIVAAVFQPGYLFKGQLLRPARVAVRKWSG